VTGIRSGEEAFVEIVGCGRSSLQPTTAVPAKQAIAGRYLRSLYISTALAAVLGASVGLGPARAQSVTGTGNVYGAVGPTTTPLPPPPLPVWSIPTEALYVGITAPGTLTIEGGGSVSDKRAYVGNVSTGTVTVTGAGSTWTNSSVINIGYGAVYGTPGTGTLIIEDGGYVYSGVPGSSNTDTAVSGIIGTFYAGVGTVTVSGTDAGGHASTWENAGQLMVGRYGQGTLNIEGGGTVSNADDGYIGVFADSNGTVTVSGTDGDGHASTWANSGDLYVSVYGTGTLNIEAGGVVSNVDGVIGYDNTGSATVTGTDGSGNASTWTNSGDLYVGYYGDGTLTIAGGGKVSASGVDLGDAGAIAGTINIGAAAGDAAVAAGTLDVPTVEFGDGTGTLVFNHTGATTFAAALTSTGSGTHALNHYAGTTTLTGDSSGFKGTTTVDGGTLEIAEGGKLGGWEGYIGRAAGSDGTVVVTGAGSTWDNTSILYVGDQGRGTLTIKDGGTVASHGAAIGESFTGEEGVATVTGAGSTWTTGQFDVGFGITGTLTVADGGKVTSTASHIGFGATGTATVTGAGSTWTSDSLAVGLWGNSGDGTLTIAEGGKVVAPTVGIGTNSGSAGTINIGAAAGDAAVAAGTLDAATIQFGNGAGTLVFNHTGALTFAAALSSTGGGTHALDHYAGVTTLTGDSSGFTGTTTVSGGALNVGQSGSSALGGTINVLSGASLGGTGNLGSPGSTVTIAAGGVHAPGMTQSILGDYVNHGILRIEASPTAADKIVVAGGVDVTGATLDLVLSPANAASWNVFNGPFTVIDKQSAGTVTGTFGTITRNLLFLDAQLAYDGGDGNDVTLEMVRNDLDFAGVGQTRNQRAAGAAVDALGNGNVLWRSIALTSDPDIVRKSFDALSGEIHASAKPALIEDSHFLRDAVDDRIRSAFDSVGATTMPVLAYGETGTDIGATAAIGHALAPADTASLAAWGSAFGSWGSINGDGNAAGLDRSVGGFFTGIDGLVMDDVRLGIMTGYSRSSFDVDGRDSSGQSDNYHLGVYGGGQWGALGLRAGAAYTWHNISMARSVAIPGFADSLTADYNAGTFQAFGEAGYRIDTAAASFEPFANLAYVNLHTDSFTEKGGAAALHADSQTTDTTFATLGIRASTVFDVGGMKATARGTVGWRHAFSDTTPLATLAFAGSNTFTIAGVPISKDSAVVEAGLDLNLSPRATLGLSYTDQLASGAQDHSFKANLAIRF